MGGSIEKLRQSLDMVREYTNDHDYIARCRPVDIRAALHKIDEQQAEIERLRAELKTTYTCLGPEYDGEWELCEKRRPLDSLVSEIVGQLYNATDEIKRLRYKLEDTRSRVGVLVALIGELNDEAEDVHKHV